MSTIDIKINTNKINYAVQLHSRVNIIQGDSATGKSHLIRLIDGQRNTKINIQSTYKLLHINSILMLEGLPLNNDTVYILDDSDGIENEQVLDIINKSQFKFILMTREFNPSNINYGNGQIYELKQFGKYNISSKVCNKNLNGENTKINNRIEQLIDIDIQKSTQDSRSSNEGWGL